MSDANQKRYPCMTQCNATLNVFGHPLTDNRPDVLLDCTNSTLHWHDKPAFSCYDYPETCHHHHKAEGE